MQSNKLVIKLIIYFLPFGIALNIFAQAEEFTSMPTGRGKYALVAYVSGGLGMYTSDAGTPAHLKTTSDKIKNISAIRVMWHPDHLLRVGLETGYMTFYSYTFKDSAGRPGKVALRAIPVLVEWSMALTKKLNVFAGSGIYMLTTDLNYLTKSKAHKVSIGWMAAASYIQPISKNVGLGLEVKYMDAAETSDGSVCLQLQLAWKFLKW